MEPDPLPPPLRVGVWLAAPEPSLGGNFTLPSEVLGALSRLRGELRHEFHTFGWHDPSAWYGPAAPLPHLALPLALRASHALKARLSRYADGHLGAHTGVAWGEVNDAGVRDFLAHRIDVAWYLVQGACLSLEVPFITTVWDTGHRRLPFLPELGARGEWERRERDATAILPRAAAVIVGTSAGREEVERHYGVHPARLRVLPHPTPAWALEAPPGAGEAELTSLGLGAGFLVYPAQLWPHKNHATLLRALARLEARHGQRLDLVCTGSDKGNLEHLRRLAGQLGVSSRVRWLGFVGRDLLAALYRRALCLVYPSLLGPENLPPLEAFALGCPVIAARVPGAEEQLGEAALLFDPLDPAAIAAEVARLHSDPALRTSLVQRGRERARRFTAEDFVRGAGAVLDELAALRSCWG